MMRRRKLILIPLLVALALTTIPSCEKEENPYDKVDYSSPADPVDTLSPSSFISLHKNIFVTKCALPGCHDGAFEPDFRSVQSAYATLVYHRVVKHSQDTAFEFRVLPNNYQGSWLYERITTDDAVLGRMPLYAPVLTNEELQNIRDWIMNGAPDMFGQRPQFPNTAPTVEYYFATSADFQTVYSNDRQGGVPYNPFLVPDNTDIKIAIAVDDDSTEVADMQSNILRLSTDADDFSNAISVTASYFSFSTNSEFWVADINTADFPDSQTVYMRYYVNDGDQPIDTEFPVDDSNDAYKTYWSFIVN